MNTIWQSALEALRQGPATSTQLGKRMGCTTAQARSLLQVLQKKKLAEPSYKEGMVVWSAKA